MLMVPKHLQTALWSYDLSTIDPDRDKGTIITQVLNYGNKQAIDWVLERYGHSDIEAELAHPRRGVWNKLSYNFWTTLFNVPKKEVNFWPPHDNDRKHALRDS